MAELNSLIRYMFDLCKNQSSPIYTKGEATRFIDIRYPPTLKKRAAPSIPSSTSSTNTHKTISSGGIAAAVICSVVGAALIGLSVLVCIKRKRQIVEWLLYKLGNFRFNSLREERSRSSVDMLSADINSRAEGGLEMEVGSEALDDMPMPDDF
mmetsp:Transcript_7471/g.10515  ORF Transcript_7471/g.10515 Transcript_7471/m.10515 type:complete len:153 (+) Transcript_7471:2288-2746(+)